MNDCYPLFAVFGSGMLIGMLVIDHIYSKYFKEKSKHE